MLNAGLGSNGLHVTGNKDTIKVFPYSYIKRRLLAGLKMLQYIQYKDEFISQVDVLPECCFCFHLLSVFLLKCSRWTPDLLNNTVC